MTDDQILVDDSVFRVGRVIGVQGRTVKIQVDKAKNGSHLLYRGQVLRNVSVGGYIKICKGFSDLVAKVDGEVVGEPIELDYQSKRDRIDRVLTVSLVGFFSPAGFQRGVRELPLVQNECFLLTDEEFERIHNFVPPSDTALTIAKLAMEKGQPVRVGVNSLFASHIGIFGNTGSGKSYTLAKLYHELLTTYGESKAFKARARFVLIDFNGEYVDDPGTGESAIVDASLKTNYVLNTRRDHGDRLPMDKATMEDPTFWSVLLNATEKTQAPFLDKTLQSPYWESRFESAETFKSTIGGILYAAINGNDASSVKAIIINFLEEIVTSLGTNAPQALTDYIHDLQVKLNFHSGGRSFFYSQGVTTYYSDNPGHDAFFRELTYDRISAMTIEADGFQSIDRIRFKIVLAYYSDTFRGYANREHLGPLIKRLETLIPRIKRLVTVSDEDVLAKPLTVISLRDVSLDMKKVLPLLICRQLYERKKSRADGLAYLNIVIDEAHNILSSSSAREGEAWKDYRLETFEEIVKEGRKFGVFLTIASQRPHDISETIISQLHNYFLHRLVNNLDILAIEKAVAYLDRVSFESLPILPTGNCVLSGISAQIPLIIAIEPIAAGYEPNNKTMTLTDKWHADLPLEVEEDLLGLPLPEVIPEPPTWEDEPPF